jgi:hypothetical protein
MGFEWLSPQTTVISLNSINQLIFVMVSCGVLFGVQTDLLNTLFFRRASSLLVGSLFYDAFSDYIASIIG